MNSKKISLIGLLLIVIVSVFAASLYSLLNRQASTFVVSTSGDYLIESVSARSVLVPFEDLAYLRVADKRNSGAVYRSPLYAQNTADMTVLEDNGVVGIVWVDFYKNDQHFGIRVPDWKGHWLNWFVSNTPYEVMGD